MYGETDSSYNPCKHKFHGYSSVKSSHVEVQKCNVIRQNDPRVSFGFNAKGVVIMSNSKGMVLQSNLLSSCLSTVVTLLSTTNYRFRDR